MHIHSYQATAHHNKILHYRTILSKIVDIPVLKYYCPRYPVRFLFSFILVAQAASGRHQAPAAEAAAELSNKVVRWTDQLGPAQPSPAQPSQPQIELNI